MAIVIENGTGLANAEGYISVADSDTYHTNFGNDDWTGTDGEKEIGIRQATQYLDQKYVLRWKGISLTSTQALDWPRGGVITADGYTLSSSALPLDLVHACAELAVFALTEDLVPAITSPGTVKRTRIKVGPIEDETEYFGQSQIKLYRIVDTLLLDLIQSGSRLTIGQS